MSKGLSYRDAGVDIDEGDALVEAIKPFARRTLRPEVLAGIGGFGALCEIPKKYKQPVLVSGTDGVGTKLKLAFALGRHDTVGIDLVAMSVNDVLVQGAEPLFFRDYFACGKLETAVAAEVVKGIARGCELAGCALLGGETAEMPGMYPEGEYDLAGFCVGVVEKARIIDGRSIAPGDAILGLASSGPHSNGYSLIRKILEPGKGPRAHHRRRHHRQRAPHPSTWSCREDQKEFLAPSARVPVAPAHRQRRRGRDVPRLQLRHRHGLHRRPRRRQARRR